ncbi:MAG: hypothetical protein NTY75_02255 [Candidatus Shapirobacteria bacterium]|nr:hypothetical protein [Candidatus Shapirobacteria bacterium]
MVSNFWLISIDDSAITVSLSANRNNLFKVESIGDSVNWQYPQLNSFLTAVDESLASCAELISLPPDSEPNTAAFVVPASWIGPDGRIQSEFKKIIEQLCSKLKFKPLGFISHDEAIVEQSSEADGLPVSFILLYLTPINFDLSLVYLGKIKQRIHQPLTGIFTPELLETSLNTLNSDSTLPPQVIVMGQYEPQIIEDFKNYPWIGKKTVETFLHFPDFIPQTPKETIAAYNDIITHQFQPQNFVNPPTVTPEIPVITTDSEDPVEVETSPIVEVEAASLNFEPVASVPEPSPTYEVIPIESPLPSVTPKPRFKLPHLSLPALPRLHLPSLWLALIIPALSPLLLIFLVFFYRLDLTLFFTPIDFSENIDVVLDPAITQITSANHIPVIAKKFDINLTLSTNTTGQKVIGDKAKGQIIIYNKTDKVQNLPKDTVLVSGNTLKFVLTSSVQVPASSSNLDLGIITMGQSKAVVEAADIGPEYNLGKDAKLSFKDIASISMETKIDTPFTGGTKNQVAVVAAADKQGLENQISTAVTANIDQKMTTEVASLSGLLTQTINITHNRNDYNREIGEQADQLTVQSSNTITAYVLDSAQKKTVINDLLAKKPELSATTFNPDKFTFDFIPDKTTDKTQGKLTIKGQLTPEPDVNSFRHQIVGKTASSLAKIIPVTFPRVYNYALISNLSPISRF